MREGCLRLAHRACAVRAAARDQEPGAIQLPGEVIGIACQITGVEDPAGALSEIVQDALTRWARVQVLDRIARSHGPLDEPTACDACASGR